MADEFVAKALQKAHNVGDKIWCRIISNEGKFTEVNLTDAALSSALGGVTFPLCLGALQTVFFRPLRITSNLRLIGCVCGSFSLLISGSTASLAFLSSILLLRENNDSSVDVLTDKLHLRVPDRCPVAISVCYKDTPLYGFASLVVFKLLGGKFRSVLPSSLIHPGAFARGYIPAKGQNYASVAVRQKLTLLGKKYGCHSCGKRWRTSFVGDHMPPNKLVRKGQRQWFYPQCTSCSSLQGAAVSSMSRLLRVKTHGSSLRLYHLWLPLPIPLALLRNYVSDKSDMQDSDIGSDIED
ncbi:hypothetical protein OS493_035111 [Desmophyllum pertusum]|uniref:Uncharacterized protein n=1 Tax=Desmophyllum pertusum TaxID=174260 RepID=A0A9W9Z6Z3_9CNID|nr:hypothetical protein OS493_035111 [Desmophyllum pertusum]